MLQINLKRSVINRSQIGVLVVFGCNIVISKKNLQFKNSLLYYLIEHCSLQQGKNFIALSGPVSFLVHCTSVPETAAFNTTV